MVIRCRRGTQHQILHHSIKLGKVDHIFITHMHGDHIFGLPGLLTSRSFQGGEDKPLTLIGPTGLQQFIETALKLSESHLNYPITYIEIDNNFTYHHNGFTVSSRLLNHGIPSYGYRIEAPTTPGTIDVTALKAIGLEPGPKYQEVKCLINLNIIIKFIFLKTLKVQPNQDLLLLFWRYETM